MSHQVRPLGDGELGEAVAVASRAFWPDPLLGYFSRGLLHEYGRMPSFFSTDIRDKAPYAEISVVDVNGRIGGLAMWIAPGLLPRPAWEQVRSALRAGRVLARAKNRAKAVRLMNAVERAHPHDPHWYLALLATDPAGAGHGRGQCPPRPDPGPL